MHFWNVFEAVVVVQRDDKTVFGWKDMKMCKTIKRSMMMEWE